MAARSERRQRYAGGRQGGVEFLHKGQRLWPVAVDADRVRLQSHRAAAACGNAAFLCHAQHAGDVMGVIPGDRNGITGGRAVYKKSGQGGPLLALGILKSF